MQCCRTMTTNSVPVCFDSSFTLHMLQLGPPWGHENHWNPVPHFESPVAIHPAYGKFGSLHLQHLAINPINAAQRLRI